MAAHVRPPMLDGSEQFARMDKTGLHEFGSAFSQRRIQPVVGPSLHKVNDDSAGVSLW